MFVSRRIIRPEVGKTELAHERVHKLAGLIGGHGVGTRVSKVMAGEGAGDLHLYVYFETMSQAMAVGEAMTADAGIKALMAEREANPAAIVHGANGSRPSPNGTLSTNRPHWPALLMNAAGRRSA